MTDLREKVARKICALEEGNWNARNFNETPNGESPKEMRERLYYIAASILAIPEIAAALAQAKAVDEFVEGIHR